MAKLVVYKNRELYTDAAQEMRQFGGLYGWLYKKGDSQKGLQPKFFTKSQIKEFVEAHPDINCYFNVADRIEGAIIEF